MLFVFSSMNLIAKLTRRRVSDVLFGPTLIFFCVLHLLRQSIAQSSLIGFDGRIPAAISSGEYDKLTLLGLFTTNAALRLNGNVAMLFWTKTAVLGLNVVPLLFSRSTSVSHSTNRRREMNSAERVLAIRPLVNAGLGMSTQVSPEDLGAYDLVRHGYILYGDLVVMSITDYIL